MNPLDEIWDRYLTARDALHVALRVVDRGIAGAITNKHRRLAGEPPDEQKSRLSRAERQLDNLVVLAMVAAFERTLREHVRQVIDDPVFAADMVRSLVRDQCLRDAEFWNSSVLIDVFGSVVEAIRGEAKQLVDFRNWIAHGHHLSRPAPFNATPRMAYQRLTRFLKDAQVVS